MIRMTMYGVVHRPWRKAFARVKIRFCPSGRLTSTRLGVVWSSGIQGTQGTHPQGFTVAAHVFPLLTVLVKVQFAVVEILLFSAVGAATRTNKQHA